MFQYNRDGLTLEGADLCLEMMTSKSNSTATPHAGTKAAYVKVDIDKILFAGH